MLDYNLIGERFKKIRDESGFTQAQIADYLEVDQSYISRYEKNERKLSIDMLEKLANLFGCPIDYFTSDEATAYKPLPLALRATGITSEDLESIASVNRIALNLKKMLNI